MVSEKSGIILTLDPQSTRIFFIFCQGFYFSFHFWKFDRCSQEFDSTWSVWCSMTYVGLRLVCDNHQREFLAIVTFVPCFCLAIFFLVFPAGIYDTFVPCGILQLSFLLLFSSYCCVLQTRGPIFRGDQSTKETVWNSLHSYSNALITIIQL